MCVICGAFCESSTICSCADKKKHQSPASLAFVRGIHRWPVDSPHKGPVTGKCFIWWRHDVNSMQEDNFPQLRSPQAWMGEMVVMWRLDLETLSALWVLCRGFPPLIGGFSSQRASNAGCFNVFFHVYLNKWSNCQWSEMPWPLCDAILMARSHSKEHNYQRFKPRTLCRWINKTVLRIGQNMSLMGRADDR